MQSFLQKDNFTSKFCKGKKNVRLCMVEIQKKKCKHKNFNKNKKFTLSSHIQFP